MHKSATPKTTTTTILPAGERVSKVEGFVPQFDQDKQDITGHQAGPFSLEKADMGIVKKTKEKQIQNSKIIGVGKTQFLWYDSK